MPLIRCPRCLGIVISDSYNNDIIHQCDQEIEALQNEDLVNTGKFVPIDRTNTNVSTDGNLSVYLQGLENKADGIAKIEGVRIHDWTNRGNRKQTHRTRQHFEFIDFR